MGASAASPGADAQVYGQGDGTLTGRVSGGVHVMMFRTDEQALAWLNQTIAVGEGSIDPARGLLAMRYYACAVDHRPDLGA